MLTQIKIFSITIILWFSFFKTIIAEEDILDIINTDNESSLREAITKQNINGGTIYINTTIINIKTDSALEIKNDLPGGIIGIKQPNNEYPRLNFEEARNNGWFDSLKVYGSNKYIKNIIIENSPTYGIHISGKKHLFDHLITRYNQYAGIFLSSTSNSNTFNYCYSYRNCDIKGTGLNGDGFYSNGAMNTIFNHCYSWDNSNNGFSVSNHELEDSSMTFSHSACWNNGNINIFTGKYDFDNGKPLDKNMLTIQQLIESNTNYEKNYLNKQFSIENCKIDRKNANDWVNSANSRTKGNGFQFGFAYAAFASTLKRIAELSVAFDHKSIGFDNNYSKNYRGYIFNCASFNNKINYQLPYIFEKWSNNWSWGATQLDQNDMEEILKTPSKISSSQKLFYSVRDQIIKEVSENKFPDDINFDKSISNLN